MNAASWSGDDRQFEQRVAGVSQACAAYFSRFVCLAQSCVLRAHGYVRNGDEETSKQVRDTPVPHLHIIFL